MDFVVGLLRSPRRNNAIWVTVHRLTKSVHFIPFRVGQSTEALAEKYKSDCMESLLALYQTEIPELCRISGEVFRGA